MADAEQIKRVGWSQGSIVGAELAQTLAQGSNAEPARVWVIASPDCDVVHASFEVDPQVELVAAVAAAKPPDGQLSHGRNPRVLQLPDSEGRLEFRIAHRLAIERTLLARHAPTRTLDDAAIRMLARWVAKRYVRQAFPDAFNERIRPATRKIDRALKRHGVDASGIFVALNDWGELQEQDAYRAVISVVFPDAVGLDEAREAKLAQLAAALRTALDACDGIEVADARHLGESEVTLHDLHTFKRWEFDFRSHSGRPGGPISPQP